MSWPKLVAGLLEQIDLFINDSPDLTLCRNRQDSDWHYADLADEPKLKAKLVAWLKEQMEGE